MPSEPSRVGKVEGIWFISGVGEGSRNIGLIFRDGLQKSR